MKVGDSESMLSAGQAAWVREDSGDLEARLMPVLGRLAGRSPGKAKSVAAVWQER